MKKILTILGLTTLVVAPTMTLVSCGDPKHSDNNGSESTDKIKINTPTRVAKAIADIEQSEVGQPINTKGEVYLAVFNAVYLVIKFENSEYFGGSKTPNMFLDKAINISEVITKMEVGIKEYVLTFDIEKSAWNNSKEYTGKVEVKLALTLKEK